MPHNYKNPVALRSCYLVFSPIFLVSYNHYRRVLHSVLHLLRSTPRYIPKLIPFLFRPHALIRSNSVTLPSPSLLLEPVIGG